MVSDAVGQAELVRQRPVSPLELVDAAIARIEASGELNAVVTRSTSLEVRRRDRCRTASASSGARLAIPGVKSHPMKPVGRGNCQLRRDIAPNDLAEPADQTPRRTG